MCINKDPVKPKIDKQENKRTIKVYINGLKMYSGNSLVLCDDPEGWDGWAVGGRHTKEGVYVYL